MRHLTLLVIITTLLFTISCKENRKDKISRLVVEWQEKEIIFPKNTIFTKYVNDTVDYQIPTSDYKVLIYVDSAGCTSCKLQLDKWKKFIAYSESIAGDKVSYIFFFHPKDYKEIRYLLKRDTFNRPICIDKYDQLKKLNKFPDDIHFNTFLLDKNNKVVIIGNPIHNLAIKDLYIKELTKHSHSEQKTTVSIDKTTVDFGIIKKSDIKKAIFTLKNTGNYPLVILDTSTTCGCVSPSFDKRPASIGDSLHITIEIRPKESGQFKETVTVKCNTEHFLKLNIKGQVI